MEKKKGKQEAETAKLYTKKALLTSAQFQNRRDMLDVLIEDEEEISILEAQKRLEKFMKRKVK
ncbi:MAG: hypothetical protein HFE73_10170 [Firmicutes bacterium]|nr:hypothetical protein [Bacillota bacterium]